MHENPYFFGIQATRNKVMEKYTIAFLFAFLFLIILICPIVTISSLNLLFNTQIPINYKTYFAIFWLSVLVNPIRPSRNK